MKSLYSTSAMSAMPMGAPGWPELAFCTASMLSTLIALASVLRDDINYSREYLVVPEYFSLAGIEGAIFSRKCPNTATQKYFYAY